VVLSASVYVGRGVTIGDDCCLLPGVRIYAGTEIGRRVRIHANAVVGADGFGYEFVAGHHEKVPQIGRALIEDDVEIGAGTTIDRGAIDDTVIGDGVKIDNQVQIGHNCTIGNHTVICGCVGIVGSTRIGAQCVLAGGVGVGGDGPIEIVDGVVVSGMTHVSRSIAKPGVYSGGVLHSAALKWKRNALRFAELDDLAKRIALLEKSRG